ncbi:TetR family transcriptional regulator [Paenibacillus glycanilyticus]|uniref:TetR family regulatory protein n=1 Tax=Paenibacillus glycanilyticus TaxID=126569 RepID=A0ABQ6GGX6_9BACL|nr:TetR family transcriptional regulator [Paenibacillus glycanilyticus]GLX69750.1 putative TetR family regulatory protein [Paenibacillus glycanilyticus]
MRNAEATRELILNAAMEEFSALGIAGARVDRIAKAAGCNKNLIYIYFENKETLFATVLQKYIDRAFEAIPFTPDNLPDYAARVFDFAMANPHLMRLMMWSNLEQMTVKPIERGALHDQKLQQISDAQSNGRIGSAFEPKFILTSLMVLATAWTATNPFGAAMTAEAPSTPELLKESITKAVSLIVEAK